MAINFLNNGITFTIRNKRKLKKWIEEEVKRYGKKVGNINYMFCSDEYIIEINKKYLNHNYYTDIITFDYCKESLIEGDIIISVDTVRFNSKKYSNTFEEELLRVIVHGILHLLGYNDKNDKEKLAMTQKENEAINRYLDIKRNG